MKGKTFVVTGANGALGSQVAAAAVAQGATVARIDVTEIGGGALDFGSVDLKDFSAARQVIEQIVSQTGCLDVLVNVAGGFVWCTLEDSDLSLWESMYDLNVKTALNCCKAALPHLGRSRSGRIVNIGAMGAGYAAAGMGAYASSKTAIAKLTESLAEEMRGRNVTVNAVLPSIIDTPANRRDMPDANFSKWVSPVDIAAVILFLASDDAKAITGALIPVAGAD